MPDTIPFQDTPLVIRRKRLINKNFTIIAQNCMAGYIYHQLGMKFLTPTINLFFLPNDFNELLRHLQDYMQSELVEDTTSQKDYPVGILKAASGSHPIRVFFQHYDNFDVARKKWEERKSRINYNNLYVIAYDDWRFPSSDEDFDDFRKLPYEHKIMITGNCYSKSDLTFPLNDCVINGHVGKWWDRTDNVRHSLYFEKWNYVQFLNQ